MRRGMWAVAVLLGLIVLSVADLTRADMKLAIFKVKGMVCLS